jgi:hypothetical protein
MNTDQVIDIQTSVFMVSRLAAEAAPRNDSIFPFFSTLLVDET